MNRLGRLLTGIGMVSYSFLLQADGSSPTIPVGLLPSFGLNATFVAKFSLFVAVILLWSLVIGKVLKKLFRLPIIAGQIIAGIILGPSCIDIAHRTFFMQHLELIDYATGSMYSMVSSDLFVFFVLLMSSALTVSYLMWIAGHETDIKDVVKVGGVAVAAGFFGALLPIVMVGGLYFSGLTAWSQIHYIALGLIFSATSVSIPVAMLFSLQKMHLRSSKATLGAAVVDDIVAVILLSVFFLYVQAELLCDVNGEHVAAVGHDCSMGLSLVYLACSLGGMLFVGHYIMPVLIQWLRRNYYGHLMAPIATGIMLLYFSFAELVGGLAGITGAYFAGLFHRTGDTQHRAEKIISPFVNTILLPLFLGSIGLQVNVGLLHAFDWFMVVVLLIIAIISKLVSCVLAALCSNLLSQTTKTQWTWLEMYLFGSSMVARGEVGLVIATILYGSRIIMPDQYVVAVVVIVLTTIATPIMLMIGFSRLRIVEVGQDYALNIGFFKIIGTQNMFRIIMGQIEATGQLKTSISISEGRQIINIESQNVKIIFCPDKGIIFKGDKHNIENIVQMLKKSISGDLTKLKALHNGH